MWSNYCVCNCYVLFTFLKGNISQKNSYVISDNKFKILQ